MDEVDHDPNDRPRDRRVERERTESTDDTARVQNQRNRAIPIARSDHDDEGQRDLRDQAGRYDDTRHERETTPPRQRHVRDDDQRSISPSLPKKAHQDGRQEKSQTREVARDKARDRTPPRVQGAYRAGNERDDRVNRIRDEVGLHTPPLSGRSAPTDSEQGERSDAGKKCERDRTPTSRQRSPVYDDDEHSERAYRVKEKERVQDGWVTGRKKKERVRGDSQGGTGSEDDRRSRSPRGQRVSPAESRVVLRCVDVGL